MDEEEYIEAPEEPALNSFTQHTLLVCIVMGVTALVGVVGNGLMLRAYFKYSKLRNALYTAFCSLSIADTIYMLIAVPEKILNIHMAAGTKMENEERVDLWCKSSYYLMGSTNAIAANLMVVLSALRAILLTHRSRSTQPKPIHLVVISLVIYVVSFAACVPLIDMRLYDTDACYFSHDADVDVRLKEIWIFSLLSLFLPFGLVVVIHIIAHMLGKRFFSDSYSPREKEKSRLIVVIIAVFALCQFPYAVFSIYAGYSNDYSEQWFETRFEVENYLLCLLMFDKAVRPVLYSKLASDLCEAFDEVINCTHCTRAELRDPLYDRPVLGPPLIIPEEPYCVGNSQGSDLCQTEVSSQRTLVENVEVHSCETGGVGAIGDDAADTESDNSRESAVESLGRSCQRLISTSSTTSNASATSSTPLVHPCVQEEEVEMITPMV